MTTFGWGVPDSRGTPGGCWTFFAAIETDGVGTSHQGDVFEHTSLGQGEVVDLERGASGQDGFAYLASVVRKR